MASIALLAYAPVAVKSRWRRAGKWVVRIVLAAGVVLIAKTGYTRARMLEADPCIGPVDWRLALTSPTFMKAAWTLALDPQKKANPATFGAESGKLSLAIAHPLTFKQGQLQIDLIVRNNGARTVVLPPFATIGGISYRVSCMCDCVVAMGYPALGRGSRLVAPGTSVTVPVRFVACSRPTSAVVCIELFDRMWAFDIFPPRWYSATQPCENWADVPAASIRCIYENQPLARP